ncbi:hypothetical protein M405DRAFT_743643, partial [Rhizopogon salebrosus TDB-379]
PADIITYRLNDKMMYVPPAENFDQAVTFARSAFDNELTGVHNSRISFSLNVLTNGKQTSMGISSVAWAVVVSRLEPYEIIDVHVQPEIQVLCYLCRSSSEGGANKQQHHDPSVSTSDSPSLSGLIPRRLFRQLRR